MATINEQKIAVQNPVELAQHSNPNSVALNKTKQEALENTQLTIRFWGPVMDKLL